MDEIALLREAVRALDGAVFAVLDGAQFADLPDALLRAGLKHRPLYLDRGDNHPERLVTAPQMLGPLDDERLDRTLTLLGEASPAAAVFWLCSAGADSLFRHLRGINMVRIPKSAINASRDYERDPARPKSDDDNDTHETVLFRHADANVMAQIAPALEAPQLARLLGLADALFFLPSPDWQDPAAKAPVRILRKQPHWPKAQGGLLTLPSDAMTAMSSQRATALRAKRIRLLQDTSPSLFQDMRDDEIAEWAERHERSGRAVGITTERGLLQWTYLMGGSKGRFVEDPHIRTHLTTGFGTPDRKLDAMMALMVRASQENRR